MDAYISDISLIPQIIAISVIIISMILILGAALLPDEDSETWAVRKFQSFMTKRTRLAKLLRHKGADIDTYLNALSLEDLKTQRNNCENCRSFCYCDKQRKRNRLSYGDMAFCPNRKSLAPILKS